MQAERPGHVEEVDVDDLDPLLRCLLFTDGPVVGALAVQMLAPIFVERIAQSETALPADVAARLEKEAGEASVRRLASIGIGSAPAPALLAESYLLPERLPPGFIAVLDGAPDGIDQALRRVSLESRCELLWFGLEIPPDWATTPAGDEVIQRLYRIVSDRRPSILISESFAVERRGGIYNLSRSAMPRRVTAAS